MKTEENNNSKSSSLQIENIQTEIQLEFSPRVLEILASLEECFSQDEITEPASQL